MIKRFHFSFFSFMDLDLHSNIPQLPFPVHLNPKNPACFLPGFGINERIYLLIKDLFIYAPIFSDAESLPEKLNDFLIGMKETETAAMSAGIANARKLAKTGNAPDNRYPPRAGPMMAPILPTLNAVPNAVERMEEG